MACFAAEGRWAPPGVSPVDGNICLGRIPLGVRQAVTPGSGLTHTASAARGSARDTSGALREMEAKFKVKLPALASCRSLPTR